MNEQAELMNRLSFDDGNIILDGDKNAPIYIGANKLISMSEWNGHIYVTGENNTFLRIHSNLLVETLPLTARKFL